MSSTLVEFITGVPQALLKQYEYEEGHVRSGDQLMFSSFLRVRNIFLGSRLSIYAKNFSHPPIGSYMDKSIKLLIHFGCMRSLNYAEKSI